MSEELVFICSGGWVKPEDTLAQCGEFIWERMEIAISTQMYILLLKKQLISHKFS